MIVTKRNIARVAAGAALAGLLTLGAAAPAQAFKVVSGPYPSSGVCQMERAEARLTYPSRTASACIRDSGNGKWYFWWLSW